VPLENQVAFSSGGYLYVTGGFNSSAQAATSSAQIGSGGMLGAWQALSALPMALFNHAGAVQNGYAIVAGGQSPSGPQAGVYTAKLGAGGALGAWVATTPLPAARYDHAAVASGGYVYVLGGFDAAKQQSAAVSSAPQSGGSLGSWTAQPALPAALGEIAAVVANGHLYVLGGHATSGAQRTVFAAAILARGALGPWQRLTPLPQARWDLSVVVAGGALWAIGGYNAQVHTTNTVYRATLLSGGAIGTWSAAPSLPSGVGEQTATVAAGFFFVAGGKLTGTTALRVIYTAAATGL
jgi:hypothetical protein